MDYRKTFQIVDASKAGPELSKLRDEVARTHGRVEIVGKDGEACVVISKTELESLERAIELLGDTQGVKELCAAMAHLADASGAEMPPPV